MDAWKQVPVSWKTGGMLLGLVFFAAVLLVKPIGVSTQFVILDGILWDAVDPNIVVPSDGVKHGYTSTNAYLDKSGGKYAASIANPLNYGFVFVVAMMVGAFISSVLRGGVPRQFRRRTVETLPRGVRRRLFGALWRAAGGAGVRPGT